MDTQLGCWGLIPDTRAFEKPLKCSLSLDSRSCPWLSSVPCIQGDAILKGILASTQVTFPAPKGDGGSTEGDTGEPVA